MSEETHEDIEVADEFDYELARAMGIVFEGDPCPLEVADREESAGSGANGLASVGEEEGVGASVDPHASEGGEARENVDADERARAGAGAGANADANGLDFGGADDSKTAGDPTNAGDPENASGCEYAGGLENAGGLESAGDSKTAGIFTAAGGSEYAGHPDTDGDPEGTDELDADGASDDEDAEPEREPAYIPAAFAPREADPARAKALLRARMRQERDVIPAADQARDSHAVCRKILGLPQVKEGATVALYAPMGSEMSCLPFVRAAAGTLRLLAPVSLTEGLMEFVEVTEAELLAGKRGPSFLQHPGRALDRLPQGREAVGAGDIDVMLVPGVAFDRTGRRLGYGGGYYDAYLARPGLRALVVGLAFDEQICPRPLPAEDHDRRMDVVLTPTEQFWV